ncbi:NAD+ synthase, partial [Candidatus Omnitrophota bacterium]
MSGLLIDSKKVKQKLIKFIRQQTKAAGSRRLILGLSGGLDSSLALYLGVQAQGAKNVRGLILPYRTSSATSLNNAKLIARKYGVKTQLIKITPQIDAYFKQCPGANRIRRGNKMARERMSILYDQSKAWGALVLGTSNKTELLLGYGTLYGDVACAFNPLGSLYKTQIRQLAQDVGIPAKIIEQVPTAGLWPGQTDEGELGLTYERVDKLLYYLVDRKFIQPRLIQLGFKKGMIAKVRKLIA